MQTAFPASARTSEKAVPHDPAPMTAISAIAFLALLTDRVDIDGLTWRLLTANRCLDRGEPPHERGGGRAQDSLSERLAGVFAQVDGLAEAHDKRLAGQ